MPDNITKDKPPHYELHPPYAAVCFFPGRPGGLIMEITWNPGRLEVICLHGFIVVWCNLWEFRATGFDRIPHNLI